MSIHQLKGYKHQYTILDDMESVFWVLLFGALHHLMYQNKVLDMNMFDDWKLHEIPGMPPVEQGGFQKYSALHDHSIDSLKFQSTPLNDLVCDLADDWTTLYSLENSHIDWVRKYSEDKRESLKNPMYTIEKFDVALARQDWPKDPDRVADQFPRKSADAFSQDAVESSSTHSNTADASGEVSCRPSRAQTASIASEPHPGAHGARHAEALQAVIASRQSLGSPEPAFDAPQNTTPGDMQMCATSPLLETPPRPQRWDQKYVAAAVTGAAPFINALMLPTSSLRRKRSDDEDQGDVFSARANLKRVKSDFD